MDVDLVNQTLARTTLDKAKSDAGHLAEKQAREKELKEACAGFEAILLHTVIKSMRSSMPGDALFEESHSTNMYKSMYDQYLAEELSQSGTSVGVKEFLYQQLKDSL